MDWNKVLEELFRAARAAAQAAAGFFGATAVGVGGATTITPHVWLDAVIAAVLTSFAMGASRVSDGKTAIPGVAIKPSNQGPMLLLALILGVGAASFTTISMAGCASAQFDARVTPQGLSLLAGDIEEDATFGAQAAPPEEQDGLRAEVATFLEAVRSKDAARIAGQAAPRWGIIKALALNGIDFQIQTDQIGPGVADIHRESVFRFEGLLNRVR